MLRERHDSTANLSSVTHLATGILVSGGRLLMVASRYPDHPQPLWNLPGGRQLPGELLEETVVREVFEETGLRVGASEVAYVSESYDGEKHFLNVTFRVILRQAQGDTLEPARSAVLSEARSAESKGQGDTLEAARSAVLSEARSAESKGLGDTLEPARSAVLSEARSAESKGQGDTLEPARSAVLSEARGAESKDQDDTLACDHVVGLEWVPLSEVAERVAVAVVREPLVEYLGGSLVKRYAGFHEANVTIEWPQDSR